MIGETSFEWEKLLRDSVKDGAIKKTHLKKIPVLKNCTDWRDIEVLGSVDYKAKTVHYDGVMVHLHDKLYFVNRKTFNAVQEFLNIKKRIPEIKVI